MPQKNRDVDVAYECQAKVALSFFLPSLLDSLSDHDFRLIVLNPKL